MQSPLAYTHDHRVRFVAELQSFVRFPSSSGQLRHADNVRKCAEWLANHLHQIGLTQVQVIPTARHPIVYAEWRHAPGRPTVLVYGHYDVQPPEPLEAWHTPPFTPAIRGDDLYGRSVSNNKGQMFAHINELESYLKTAGRLPVNVICLFEGEEEIGSPNLGPFLRKYKARLAADVAVISDTANPARDQPAITYSLRGSLSLELEVRGPESELHSGIFGGAVHNPLQVLCEIIAQLHHDEGRVAIPGFYDRVRQCTARERAYMGQVGPFDEDLRRNAGVQSSWGEKGYSLYERTTIRPALTINGLAGGYAGQGPMAVIPSRAVAKFNFRLVPHQEPEEIERLFREHIARIAPPDVPWKVRVQVLAKPATIDRNHPVIEAAARVYHHAFGTSPVFLRNGGTIPVVNMIQGTLGIPVVLMGSGLPDDHIHGPDEKFHLPNFFKGIETSIRFLAELGAVRSRIGSLRRTSDNPENQRFHVNIGRANS